MSANPQMWCQYIPKSLETKEVQLNFCHVNFIVAGKDLEINRGIDAR